jgi:hypothetical protein
MHAASLSATDSSAIVSDVNKYLFFIKEIEYACLEDWGRAQGLLAGSALLSNAIHITVLHKKSPGNSAAGEIDKALQVMLSSRSLQIHVVVSVKLLSLGHRHQGKGLHDSHLFNCSSTLVFPEAWNQFFPKLC